MTIQIDITEEEAACLWANGTWDGLYPQPLAVLVRRLVKTEANSYRCSFPNSVRVVELFMADQNARADVRELAARESCRAHAGGDQP